MAVTFYENFDVHGCCHRVKVGEAHHPVAAAERGEKMPVSRDASFEAADRDYTKIQSGSLGVPSG